MSSGEMELIKKKQKLINYKAMNRQLGNRIRTVSFAKINKIDKFLASLTRQRERI